jgi:2-dehydro-3-deoxyglucarate aldolase/4-hydroxy-2-oxoheptanedioate aldolase
VRRSGDDGVYDDCLEKVAAAAHASRKQVGILVRSLEDIPVLRSRGFTHFAVESDIGILRSRYQQVLKSTRELCA